jgi:hypothetical protein
MNAQAAAALAMATNHIENDLRKSLTVNGYGNDAAWKCIGKVVDAAFRADMIPWEANVADALAWKFDDLNIAGMRDKMRDAVKATLGPGKEFLP